MALALRMLPLADGSVLAATDGSGVVRVNPNGQATELHPGKGGTFYSLCVDDAGGIWAYRPETQQLEIFARGWINSWGHTWDRYGQSFVTDGAGGEGINWVVPGAGAAWAAPPAGTASSARTSEAALIEARRLNLRPCGAERFMELLPAADAPRDRVCRVDTNSCWSLG